MAAGTGMGTINANTAWGIPEKDDRYRKYASMGCKNRGLRRIKKLAYNFREISNQLLRASKASSASQVLCRAKGKVGALKRCLATGNYDINEVRAAIIHAQKMVDCAKLKVHNMQEEEEAGRDGRTARKAVRLGQKRKMELMELELERKKRKHRGDEYAKIREADMEYLAARHKGGKGEKNQEYGGVSVELSFSALQISELKRMELELKQVKQQIAGQERQSVGQGSVQAAGVGDVPAADMAAAPPDPVG